MSNMSNKILIMIAAYRETELLPTVKSFYDEATNKDNLMFSIISQAYDHPDLSFIDEDKIKYIKVTPEEAQGLGWARSIIEQQFTEYDYFLHIDAHMMASLGWDEAILDTYQKATSKFGNKVFLTAIAASYKIENGKRKKLEQKHLNSNIRGIKIYDWSEHIDGVELDRVYFLKGGLLFGPKSFIDDVPEDPEIDFFSEENTRSARAYYKGYTGVFFQNPTIYHMYIEARKEAGLDIRPWNDGNDKGIAMVGDKIRRNAFWAGELKDQYSVPIEIINQYIEETGLIR